MIVRHRRTTWLGSIVLGCCGIVSCTFCLAKPTTKAANLGPIERATCDQLGLKPDDIAQLNAKRLYEFTESEVDVYLRYLQVAMPDLRQRIVHLARKNIGQPYDIFLLGEMPFEFYDPQPIYCLQKSDCLVFSEHTYAMALGKNWSNFMLTLQRLRYRDGKLGVVTRNHFTAADWNRSNRWLVNDITSDVAGDQAVAFEQKLDRANFFRNRYQLEVDIPIEEHTDVYLPFEQIELAKPHLQNGDFVNIVRGIVKPNAKPNAIFGGTAWVGHVGLIALADSVESGERLVHLIHSTKPQVREEPIDTYIARSAENLAERDAAGKPRLLGFKFLRLRSDPLQNLQEIDGPDAPKVTLPAGDILRLK